MFSKNLKYYRLKKNLTKKELASLCDVTPMIITYYEEGKRRPNMDNLRKLANALEVRVSDFLAVRNANLVFMHGEFRKNSSLSKGQQEYVREAVEEYFGRFYSAIEILGGEVLTEAPICHSIPLSGDVEQDAQALRKHLRLSLDGPVDDLIQILENKGILVFELNIENDKFSGMNGFVGERPYIVINENMTAERIRSTIAHELAHLMFDWSKVVEEKKIEEYATAVSGAFLLPEYDTIRELGIRRTRISKDMEMVCKEYGVSMYLLVKRATIANIVSNGIATEFYIQANQQGWRKNEPSRIQYEKPKLFMQLVYRAVNEREITVQRGAELLQIPYSQVVEQCFFDKE